MRKVIAGVLALGMWLSAPVAARQQRTESLRIDIAGILVGAAGGERRSSRVSQTPVVLGETTNAVLQFDTTAGACGFDAAVFPSRPTAISGWRVALTPTKIDDRAITFRARWSRAWYDGKESTGPAGDFEATLRAGESLPLDLAPLPASTRLPGGCDVRSTVLRISVSDEPMPNFDRRIVETDIWLIEHLAGGTEQSQRMTIRGLYNEPTSFYFDRLDTRTSYHLDSARGLLGSLKGRLGLDIFGRVTPRDGQGQIGLELETFRRLSRPKDTPYEVTLGRVVSTLQLKPDDVASVELPKLTGTYTEEFADRNFALRIRSRQIQ